MADIDHREPGGVQDVSSNNNIRSAEKDESVGVAVSGRLMQNFYRLVVHPQVLSVGIESFGGPGFDGKCRRFAGWRAHPFEYAVMCQDGCAAAIRHCVGKIHVA